MANKQPKREGAPVISSMEDEQPQSSAFKDDGDMRLFAGDMDSQASYDPDDGGMRLFSDN